MKFRFCLVRRQLRNIFARSYCSVPCTKKYSIIFYGSDKFSMPTLEALNKNRLCINEGSIVDKLDVVCVQNCPVHKYCHSNNISVYDWPYVIPENVYDVGISVSFGHLIQAESIKACTYGIINAHPSLLPRWRGASPTISTILHGDKETGITLFQIAPQKFDVGRILVQRSFPVPEGCTTPVLDKVLSEKSAEMVLEALENLPHLIKSSYPQPEEGVTFAKKVTPDMGEINWNRHTVIDIQRRCNAYDGIIKIYSFWKCRKVVFLGFVDAKTVAECKIDSLVRKEVPPGYCYYHKKRKLIFIRCKDGWVGFLSVVIPNRGEISAEDFHNGFITKVNSDECIFHTSCDN